MGSTAAGATAVFDLMLKLIEDDLGPEVMTEALRVFEHVAKQENLTLAYTKADVGGAGRGAPDQPRRGGGGPTPRKDSTDSDSTA